MVVEGLAHPRTGNQFPRPLLMTIDRVEGSAGIDIAAESVQAVHQTPPIFDLGYPQFIRQREIGHREFLAARGRGGERFERAAGGPQISGIGAGNAARNHDISQHGRIEAIGGSSQICSPGTEVGIG
jgi:hypothetical protein